jgi:DNA-binding beta-propeller fold protein YncE
MVTPPIGRREFTLRVGGLGLALGGCAGDAAPVARPVPEPGNALLTPWLGFSGGWRADPRQALQAAPVAGPRLNFVQPVGVAAQGDVLIVADAGARALWRLERSRDAMATFAPFTGSGAEQGASLQLGNDFSTWLALPTEHKVVQYDGRGRVVRQWIDEANAPRPVAVAVPEDRSEVLVGDGASAQVVVFNPLGRTVRVLGGRNAHALQSIAGMCLGPRGLYVLDRLAQQVVVLGPAGEVVEVIGENQLVQPRAMAVDRSGRVFVSDDVDQRIRVFRGPQLLGSAGGIGAGPGRFGRIVSLAVDGNLLYVADSVNARIQVMLVAPRSMEREGAPS